MSMGVNHDRPFQRRAKPSESVTMHEVAEGQETDDGVPGPSGPDSVLSKWAGSDHVRPSKVKSSPAVSTAMQNEEDGHETDVISVGSLGAKAPASSVPDDQPAPFHR